MDPLTDLHVRDTTDEKISLRDGANIGDDTPPQQTGRRHPAGAKIREDSDATMSQGDGNNNKMETTTTSTSPMVSRTARSKPVVASPRVRPGEWQEPRADRPGE